MNRDLATNTHAQSAMISRYKKINLSVKYPDLPTAATPPEWRMAPPEKNATQAPNPARFGTRCIGNNT